MVLRLDESQAADAPMDLDDAQQQQVQQVQQEQQVQQAQGEAEYAEEKKESEEGAGDGKTAEFPYFVGQQLDVLDDVNRWSEAEVLQVDRKESKIFITYLFWSEKFNEWIAVPSERVVPLHTHTYYPGGVLKVGQRIEVLDERRCWLEAFVIDEKRIEVQIHYRGFAPKFDEWIPRDSNRIRPYGREKEVVKRKKLRGFQATSTPRVAQITAATDRFSQYQNALRQQDLRLVSVPGDGNCLFRAVSHQIYGDDQYHDLVRQSCMDYMLSEREYFQQFIVGSDAEFLRYIDIKRQNAVWGDDPEIQAMCEIYDRPAEIWVYDQREGARKLRTFHEAAGARPGHPPMRLSYYGGGHYDSLCGSDFEAHITTMSPGELESRALERSVQRQAAGHIGEQRRHAAAAGVPDEQALEFALSLSRREFDERNDDLDEAFLEAMGAKAESAKETAEAASLAGLQPAMTDAEFEAESKRQELIESQGAIIQSVTQQSELEFIEQAMVQSLQGNAQVTEDELLQQAMQQSLLATQPTEVPLDEDDQLRMAMELSEMSDEELMRRVLEESTRSAVGAVAEIEEDDPELLAAIAQSMASR